ncbi:uncharacterized protein LOC118439060 [Folsomia candida]|uniref:uncharacterized protein LOC118439060 n=1 Tax=Folsomia candida TaxID=158441 RepID=UPI001604D162|nr:uncharacterized protein LOC118439060 [Folsomia candida]
MGRHKDLSAKAMVVKLVNYFKNEKKLFRKRSAEASWNIAKRFRQRAIDALNISAATVTRCLAENRETGKSISPRKQGNSGRKGIIVDSFTEGVIRRKILEGYTQKKFYTVKRLYEVLQEDPNFPKFKSYRTLHKIMRKQLKFKFVKFHSKPIPFERHDVQVARHSFLRSIRKLRRENYNTRPGLMRTSPPPKDGICRIARSSGWETMLLMLINGSKVLAADSPIS